MRWPWRSGRRCWWRRRAMTAKVNLPCPFGRDMYPGRLQLGAGRDGLDHRTGSRAAFSNYDCTPHDTHEYELMAPGVDVWSTLPGEAIRCLGRHVDGGAGRLGHRRAGCAPSGPTRTSIRRASSWARLRPTPSDRRPDRCLCCADRRPTARAVLSGTLALRHRRDQSPATTTTASWMPARRSIWRSSSATTGARPTGDGDTGGLGRGRRACPTPT